MEPADLNSSTEDAQLAALLRAHRPTLTDAGFTSAVVARLSRSKTKLPGRLSFAMTGALVGAAIAVGLSLSGEGAHEAVAQIPALDAHLTAWLAAPLNCTGLLALGLSLVLSLLFVHRRLPNVRHWFV